MTNSQPHSYPSQKQLDFHRHLVSRTGAGFPKPETRAQASRQIDAMIAMPREPYDERLPLDADPDALTGDATRVRSEELAGYGSNARWR